MIIIQSLACSIRTSVNVILVDYWLTLQSQLSIDMLIAVFKLFPAVNFPSYTTVVLIFHTFLREYWSSFVFTSRCRYVTSSSVFTSFSLHKAFRDHSIYRVVLKTPQTLPSDKSAQTVSSVKSFCILYKSIFLYLLINFIDVLMILLSDTEIRKMT